MTDRWQNQEEAMQFALSHPAVMLDMDMGTGKTRVAIDTVFRRKDIWKVLVVCPKAVIPVWRVNLLKFHDGEDWECWDTTKGTILKRGMDIQLFLEHPHALLQFVVVNYDIVWRNPLGNY